MPVFAADEDHHTETIGLNAFFEKGYDTTLLDHNATGHMTFVEDMRGKVVGTLAMEVLAMIYGEEPEPNEAKYMEVLINIMMTYEMENASDISEQCKMDTLKTAESLCMDAVKAGTGLLFELTNVDAAIEPLKDWLNIAVEGLGTIADNTENWIEGIGDLNALLQNYAKHDAFLYQIESLATGELQSAASKLRTAMTSAMKIKLETYSDISEKNFQNYSECFFKDMFFEALKLTEEYATDEGFQFFVELGSDVMDMVGAIDLGIEIGKLVGNVAVNGEDIINRVLEMKAVYDISVVLEHWLKDVKKRISTPYTEAMDNWAIDYVRSGNYLISCRIRGEYCMYSLLAKDSGLYSHFGEKTAQQAENVYNSLTMTLAEIKEQLDGILSVLIVNVGSEMPYEAVNANSKWNVYGRNGQLYDNYTLRIYDKQNLLNFVHTGPMDDLDPIVTEYVIDNTEPIVITLEEGYAYTFEFIDNADSEKVKLMTVGVTDNDPLLTSVVDVETEFGTDSLKVPNNAEKVNLSRDEQYRINVFLSNFSEVWFNEFFTYTNGTKFNWDAYETFVAQNASPGELIEFVRFHCWINDQGTLGARWSADGVYMTIDEISTEAERFFNRTVSLADVNNSGCQVVGDRVYWQVGVGEPYNHMTVADTMWKKTDGTYTVSFSIYQANDKYDSGPGLIGDKSVYYLSSEEATVDTGVSYYMSGTAEVRPYVKNGKNTYQLISYQLVPNEDGGPFGEYVQEQEKSSGVVNNKEGLPTQKQVKEDIQTVVKEKNTKAKVSSIEIIKSRTADMSYIVSYSVVAKTQYADWCYTVDLEYGKYDQGWFLDNGKCHSGEYTLSRVPDAKVMLDLVNQRKEFAPVEKVILDTKDTLRTEKLLVRWTEVSSYKHGNANDTYTTRWAYSADVDSWKYVKYSDDDDYLCDYEFVPMNSDFSGTWSHPSAISGITISNFSWDGFDVYCDQLGDDMVHFIPGHPTQPSGNLGSIRCYTDQNYHYLIIQFQKDATVLNLSYWKYIDEVNILAFAEITEALPVLAG